MAGDQGVAARVARDRALAVVAAVLVAVGLVLTPVAVVAADARPLLTDTDRFVATFGPLAGDRAVQDAVADAVMAGIDSRVDFSVLAATALQNVGGQLSLPPAAVAALQALGDRAAGALRAVVDDQVRSLVSSDGFAAVWRQMLRTAHAQALAGLRDDPSAGLVIRGDTLVLQVGPVLDRARQALLDRGYRVAALIPQLDRTVELVDVPGLGQVAGGHRAATALGVWLPIAAALLVVGGLVLARRRRPAVLRAGAGLALVSAVLLVVLAVVRTRLAAPARDAGAAAADRSRSLLRVAAYDVAANGVVRTATVLLVVGVVAGIVAHLLGRLLAPPAAPDVRDRPLAV